MNRESVVRTRGTSFILRVWPEEGMEPQLRGEIEHIGTGEKRFFPNYGSLLSLIETWCRDLGTTS